MAVDVVTDCHVVRRRALGDGACSGADLKEAARHFLSCTDLKDRSVLVLVEVDREGFLVGREGIAPLAHAGLQYVAWVGQSSVRLG